MKCPVCDNEFKTKEYGSEGVLEEAYGKCKDVHHFYGYKYEYGHTEEIIGIVTLHYSYTESRIQRELRLRQTHAVLELERENYHYHKAQEIAVKCETCQGKGEVFQESGAGIHATANMGYVTCPDCDGKGHFNKAQEGAG